MNSNIEKAQFEGCEWGKEKKSERFILYNEINVTKENSLKNKGKYLLENWKEILNWKILISFFFSIFIFPVLFYNGLNRHINFNFLFIISIFLFNYMILRYILKNFNEDLFDKYESVESLYRQFKKNSEEKKDKESADNFFAGELEMKLKKLSTGLPFYDFGKRFLLFLYKHISQFNFNPIKAILWLLKIIFTFAIIYFLINKPDLDIKILLSLYILILISFRFSSFFLFSLFLSLILLLVFYFELGSNLDKNLLSFLKSLEDSLTTAIPFYKAQKISEMQPTLRISHYLEILCVMIIYPLLIFSLHRKFKR